MNSVNTKKLVESFPRIFPAQLFSFECSDGWFDLLHNLCADIDNECTKLGLSNDQWTQATQIKEKFGGLRFYVTSCAHSIHDLIEAAEEKSLVTCDVCGLPGTIRRGGWIRTLCDTCEALSNKQKA